MKSKFIPTLLLILIVNSLYAWNGRGHQIIASIAYDQLTERKQKAFTDLLREHNDYEDWKEEFDNQKDVKDEGKFLFMRAAVWPDEIKGSNHNFPFINESWHYINYRVDYKNGHQKERLNPMADLLYALGWGKKIMTQKWYTEERQGGYRYVNYSKAIALSWIIHLIGDIHQPLHNVSLYNEFYPKGDAGGNKVYIRKKDNAKTVYSLHTFWDQLPGSSNVTRKTILKQADEIKAKFEGLEMLSLEERNPYIWAEEGHRKCVETVYDKGNIGNNVNYTTKQFPPALSEAYQEKADEMTDRQLYAAGVRLATFISRLQWME